MATRTFCLSLLVLLCLAHAALSLAIPAHGRFSEPVPSSATTLEARNLAGEKTHGQGVTASLGGSGGNHDFLVKGETRKDTPYISPFARGAVMMKRHIWGDFRSYRMSLSFYDTHSKNSDGDLTTTISKDDFAKLAGRTDQHRKKKTINYDAFRHGS